MEPFRVHTGLMAPLDRANVDTDAIIPKQFLKSIKRTGFGENAFDEWRYMDHGEPGVDNSKRALNPNFALNQPRYKGATILLTRKNFGCGSSREHAPWALQQFGFRAIIAPSFADIFYNNCFKNGLLPIVLSELQVDHLFNVIMATSGLKLTIDLERQVVEAPGGEVYRFEVDDSRKQSLLNGWDEIGLTLRHVDKIRAYEQFRAIREPWIFPEQRG
ncbi:MAG: 3-isopropylmalate dehydratase small subunit [Rhodocyclaceae bacterium]|nr:3-isopropylmalate dehydratase small subunit [Rhodocyclaceae bacterium]MCE2723503.1 3-isopropylmalate dehydratase small subunit [Betaproteobacteria bacterium]MCA3017268.1 3-isopropylmalate dehydratase small subunit [Rhodocyclaceae bacterium]MCA3022661.1 3-isopropylmalate dehydratase small subunit [Rhodocyclaceae bacterium]MCA3024023.1 3-isopropylmalate dehydratase small subunit [Rhodocyclaceae bacterium]